MLYDLHCICSNQNMIKNYLNIDLQLVMSSYLSFIMNLLCIFYHDDYFERFDISIDIFYVEHKVHLTSCTWKLSK